VDSLDLRGDLLLPDPLLALARREIRQMERQECRVLLELLLVHLLVVRRLRLRAGDAAHRLQARALLHVLRTRDVVRGQLVRALRGLIHLLQDLRALRHRAPSPRGQARDCAAVVAPLHCAPLLLALLLVPHRHRLVVRCHELLRALGHVRLLRAHDDAVSQVHHPLRDLHYLGAARADACGHVRDYQGGDVPGRRHRMPREQDELRPRLDHVLQLLRALFKLFIENYVTQTRKRTPAKGLPPKKETIARLSRKISRKVTEQLVPQMDPDAEDSDDGGEEKTSKKKGEAKKVN